MDKISTATRTATPHTNDKFKDVYDNQNRSHVQKTGLGGYNLDRAYGLTSPRSMTTEADNLKRDNLTELYTNIDSRYAGRTTRNSNR